MQHLWRLSLLVLLTGCGGDGNTGVERGDTLPPGAVRNLTVERTADDSVALHWGAPGDDEYSGRASRYQVRYDDEALSEASWENATLIPDPPAPRTSGITDRLEIGGLLPGRWYFALKAADEELNWSNLSNIATADLGDTIPPGVVSDLAVFAFDASSVSLTWTAPGDDGTQRQAAAYELRHSDNPISETGWDGATRIEVLHAPGNPGTQEMFTVEGLTTGRDYHFALRTVDDGGNRSTISNVVLATTSADTIAPALVNDLEVTFTAGRSVNLRWTASGDNGDQGQAAEYDLRFAAAPLTIETWIQATKANGLPTPTTSGAEESFTVQGLDLDTAYYFALRTADEIGNWSELSNGAFTTTASLVIFPHNLRGVRAPDWEPNGGRIAFVGLSDRSQIHLVSLHEGSSVQLTDHPESVSFPRWAPHGRKLAVVVWRSFFPYAHPGIGLMEPREGADPITISPHGFNAGVSAPSWSPDGARIVYSVSLGINLPSSILVVDANGGTPDTLFSNGWINGSPDWSPDGDEIVFRSDVSGNLELWVLPVRGGSPTQITNSSSIESSPRWSRDGSRIAFISDLAGTRDVWTVSSTGGAWTQVTFGPFEAANPSWSPNDDAIVFGMTQGETQNIAIQYLP